MLCLSKLCVQLSGNKLTLYICLFFLVMKDNEFVSDKFDKKNILTYGLLTQKSLIKMRTSMDINPGYDENGKEFLTMSQKWAIVFYQILIKI